MVSHPTLEKLSALKLNGMRAAVEEQLGRTDLEAMPSLDRLAMLVEREAVVRADRQLTARLRAVKLRYPGACVEGINRHARRKLSGAVLEPECVNLYPTVEAIFPDYGKPTLGTSTVGG